MSDLPIPSVQAILARARDTRESAVRLGDAAAVRQIDRVISSTPKAALCWVLGTLHIASPSGGRYQVTRAGCDCPNARKGFRQCWHVALFELLLDLFDTDCETADAAADEAARAQQLLTDRLEATARYVDSLRRAQIGRRLALARSAYL